MNTQHQVIQTNSIAPANYDFSQFEDGTAFNPPLDLIDDFEGGNIRRDRDPESFANLREAIRQAGGVTQGVTVRVNPNNPNRLQLLAGYGRKQASDLEGFSNIPAVYKIANDKQAMAIMLSENLDREDLSLADEIIAAMRFISLHDGDYELAAAELKWSVKRLKGRLVLNQCSPEVLDALHHKTIKLGHAEILSQFTEKLQNGTLKKIIDEDWSIEYLKERAGLAVRLLRQAKFDTQGCQSCQHNSEVQASLFDNTLGKAKCGNLTCFKSKTDDWVEERKAELEKEYGVVLLAIEKPQTDRNTTNSERVGESQFKEGCTGCVSNVVILQDGINSTCGETHLNQCIDTDCFRKMSNENKEIIIENSSSKDAKKTTNVGKDTKGKEASDNKNKPATKPKAVVQKTPQSVIEKGKDDLRLIGAELYADDAHFFEAFSVTSMIDKAGLSRDKEVWADTMIKTDMSPSFNSQVMFLYHETPEALQAIKVKAVRKMMEVTTSNHSVGFDPRALMLSALCVHQFGVKTASIRWTPTKEILSNYLVGGIQNIMTKSGFDKAYELAHGEGELKKLKNKKKSDLVDAVLKFEFDWGHFVPEDISTIIKKSCSF